MAGLNVVVAGTDPQNRNHYIVQSVAKAFERDPRCSSARVASYDDMVAADSAADADLFLAIGGAGAIAAPIVRAAAKARRSVLWTTEDPYELRPNMELASAFDLTFSNDRASADSYALGAAYLPLAAAVEVHNHAVIEDDKALLWDLFFTGTAWPNRVRDVSRILALLNPSLTCRIGLPGNWALGPTRLAPKEVFTDFRLSPREFAAFANRSRVTLTLDREFSSNAEGGMHTGSSPPPRVFELALAGACQVYLTKRDSEHFQFDPDEVVCVSTVDEAAEQIERLARSPVQRRQYAERARQRALAEHTYDSRVRRILDEAGDRADPARRSSQGRRKALFVTHNVAPRQPYGGVEVYQDVLARSLPDFDVLMMYPARGGSGLILSSLRDGQVAQYPTTPLSPSLSYDHRYNEVLQDVLVDQEIDIVHYHHLIGHTPTLPLISKALGVPAVATAHDYYLLCDSFNLMDAQNRFCGVSDHRPERCDVCTAARGVGERGSQQRRRHVLETSLNACSAILHNTNYTRSLFQAVMPGIEPSHHRVVGMTGSPSSLNALLGVRDRALAGEPGERLQVILLGNFTVQKGGFHLVDALAQLADDPIDVTIAGRIDAPFDEILREKRFKHLRLTGAYTHSDLPELLCGKHVSVHFSIWPETYCISVDEARAAGVVPVVVGLGGLAERVRDGCDGFVVPAEDISALPRFLRKIAFQRDELSAMVPAPHEILKSSKAHLAAVRTVYDEVIAARPVPKGLRQQQLFRRKLQIEDLRTRFTHQLWNVSSCLFDTNPTPSDTVLLASEPGSFASPMEEPPECFVVEACTGAEVISPISALGLGDSFFEPGVGGVHVSRPELAGLFVRVLLRDGAMITAPTAVFSSGDDRFYLPLDRSTDTSAGRVLSARLHSSLVEGRRWSVGVEYEREPGVRILTKELAVLAADRAGDKPRRPPFGLDASDVNAACLAARRSHKGLSFSLDRLGCAAPFKAEVTLLKENLVEVGISGWALPPNNERFDDFMIVMQSSAMSSFLLTKRAARVVRSDVLEHFGLSGDPRVGFRTRLVVEHLQPGSYQLALVARRGYGKWTARELPDLVLR